MINDLCIPLPKTAGSQSATVEVTVAGRPQKFNFRLEAFPWLRSERPAGIGATATESVNRVHTLKNRIESYDKKWELVQIYNPPAGANEIQVLFRQKQSVVNNF